MHVVEDYVLAAIEDLEQEYTTRIPVLPSFDDFAVTMQVDDEPEPLPFVSWTECIAACDIIKQFLSQKIWKKGWSNLRHSSTR
jgi:hypothetical protein